MSLWGNKKNSILFCSRMWKWLFCSRNPLWGAQNSTIKAWNGPGGRLRKSVEPDWRRQRGLRQLLLLLSGHRANEGPLSALSRPFTLRRMKPGAPRPLGVPGQRASVKQRSAFPHTYESRREPAGRAEPGLREDDELTPASQLPPPPPRLPGRPRAEAADWTAPFEGSQSASEICKILINLINKTACIFKVLIFILLNCTQIEKCDSYNL